MSESRAQEIAQTIITQLGGMRRLQLFLGAYGFRLVEKGVAFRIKNQRANYIKIVLDEGRDLYNLEVGRVKSPTYTIVGTREGLYFDDLKPNIEELTGMYLSLYEKGGAVVDGEWCVYVGEDQKIVATKKSHRAAKTELDRLWKTGKYDVAGIGSKSDAMSDTHFAKGGLLSHGLKERDSIGKASGNSVIVYPYNDDPKEQYAVMMVNLNKGKRINLVELQKMSPEEQEKWKNMETGGGVDGDQNLYVAVDEVKGYWYIISRPTSKSKAESMVEKASEKVVTLAEARAHKKVIGEEYLTTATTMAKGGGIRAKKQYNRDAEKYKFFVVDLEAKRAISGWEFRGDANDALQDFEDENGKTDPNFKVVAVSGLAQLGVKDPREDWYERKSDGSRYKLGGPIKAGTPAFNKWERKVIDILIDKLEIANGDAQSIVEAHQSLVDKCYAEKKTPQECADLVDKASLGESPAPAPTPTPKIGGKDKKVKDIATYIPNRDIRDLTIVLHGELKKIKGSDIIDGVYLKKNQAASKGLNANEIFEHVVKLAKELVKQNHEYDFEVGFDASDIQLLLDAGLNATDIEYAICGYKIKNFKADAEFGYKSGRTNGLLDYVPKYQKEGIATIANKVKSGRFEIGLKYPSFNWETIVKKYKIKPNSVFVERNGAGNYRYKYEVFLSETVAIGQTVGYYKNGKWESERESNIVIGTYSPKKFTPYQKDREHKYGGFNANYWGVVCKKKEDMYDIIDTLMSQKDGYVKDLDVYSNGLGGIGKAETDLLKFEKGGKAESDARYTKELQSRAEGLMKELKEKKILKQFLPLRGGSRKGFQIIVPSKKYKGEYDVYESMRPSLNGAVLQSTFDEDTILILLKQSLIALDKSKQDKMAKGGNIGSQHSKRQEREESFTYSIGGL